MILLKIRRFFRTHEMTPIVLSAIAFICVILIAFCSWNAYVNWNNATFLLEKIAIENTKTVNVKNIKNY